jgi:hypothetical protein
MTQGRATCLASLRKVLARSNDRIDNYDCYREPRLLHILRQNPNLTLIGLYHKAELYLM